MIENKPFMKNLKCKLSNFEKAEIAKQLVELVGKKEEVEYEKQAASSRYGSQLKEIWKEIAELGKKHREGEEYREVECYTHFDWENGVVSVIRIDTHETVSTRTVTSDERQIHLDEIEVDSQNDEEIEEENEAASASAGGE